MQTINYSKDSFAVNKPDYKNDIVDIFDNSDSYINATITLINADSITMFCFSLTKN